MSFTKFTGVNEILSHCEILAVLNVLESGFHIPLEITSSAWPSVSLQLSCTLPYVCDFNLTHLLQHKLYTK